MKPQPLFHRLAMVFAIGSLSAPVALCLTVTAESPNVTVDTRDYFQTTLASLSNGNITGTGSFAPGSSATLTAVPSPGYLFVSWTGDASGTSNPLTITMDANKTIGATFSPDLADGDNDGLTNYDESVTYGTDPALTDTDGDGLSDAWEVGRGRFSIVAGSFTWSQARADARSKGGDLVCRAINSYTKQGDHVGSTHGPPDSLSVA